MLNSAYDHLDGKGYNNLISRVEPSRAIPLPLNDALKIVEKPKAELINILRPSLSSFKTYIPDFLQRAKELLHIVEEGTKEELEEAISTAKDLNEDIEQFRTAIAEFAHSKKNKHTPEGVICRDLGHSVGSGQNILGVIEMFVADIVNDSADKEKSREYLHMGISKLIYELEAFTAIDESILVKSELGALLPYIREAFADFISEGFGIDMDEEVLKNHALLCEGAVFKNIIKEIKENYRKYGTGGRLSVRTHNNKLLIALTNKKKQKGQFDTSTHQGVNILKDYAEMLGGRFTGDYEKDVAITTLTLPLYE